MKDSKSLTSIFLLFIVFFVSSRYIQILIHDYDLNIVNINQIKKKCIPEKDSVLSFLKQNNRQALVIIIDSYPDPVIYKKITGQKSLLHNYLENNSLEFLNTSSIHKHTYVSLANTLGKLPPKSKCRYPFFRGNYIPNMILNNKWVGSSKALCQNVSKFKSKNTFVRFLTRIEKKFNTDQNETTFLSKKCSLQNIKIIPSVVNKIKSFKKLNNNIQIIHEMKFHDLDIYKKASSENALKIINLDKDYAFNIAELITKIKESKLVDEVIVMSDHGPRFQFYEVHLKNKIFHKDSLIDRNNFGIFVSRFDLNSDLKVLDRLIPKPSERFSYSRNGDVIRLKNFINYKI